MRRGCQDEGPDCPDTTDIERWMLVAPSKQQRMTLSTNHYNFGPIKPSYFCTYYLTFDAFKLLCNSPNSVLVASNDAVSRELSQTTPQRAMVHSRLETLPPELIAAIFPFHETRGFISLGLCSQTLWTQAITWAQSGYIRWNSAYSWAGTPMICAGSRLEVFPHSISEIFPRARPEVVPQGHAAGEGPRTCTQPRLWFDEATEKFEKSPIPYDDDYREEFWKQIRSSGIPIRFYEPMAASFPTFTIRPGTKWYLRNLTQKEYIRMEAIVTADGEVTISFLETHWLTLDILLLWLISWRGKFGNDTWSWEHLRLFQGITDEGLGDIMIDPTYGPLDHDFWLIWAGNWAGHSLDVVADEVLEGWVDQSDMIKLLSGKVLRTLYGLAMAEVGGAESEYWAKIFEQSGEVVDLQLYSSGSSGEDDQDAL
ncbi:hypothetical protein NCS52_00908300 [Fusarium sp. LHS14.1]|nr:hypothetical protein NCS52_00908300 [Fusarium sp. LHS14.1]